MFFHPHKVRAAATFLKQRMRRSPAVVFIGGSGIAPPPGLLRIQDKIPFRRIPHFRKPTVAGHEGMLLSCDIGAIPVWLQLGRTHRYEGLEWEDILFPLRVYRECGAHTVFLSNAAGAAHRKLGAGDLMMITDHLYLMGNNPMIGPNDDKLGPRFPDLSDLYDSSLCRLAARTARKSGIRLHRGVYAAVTGPSYETKAEIRMLRSLGADAVGMSTAPEAIFAHYLGMKVFGVSLISNASTPSHADVLNTAQSSSGRLFRLIASMIETMKP